ncbi:hypothetical protein B0H16DRAFT_1485994 [Mycena metata]|uniref:Uncharacterized protein n=1 Tax=Mycena metata TaxID=1033252 RepID=A0AAD7DMI0_9AGAR|nr:hypothetical protein B0H16DRAFT_1485994 [Mycena metata]
MNEKESQDLLSLLSILPDGLSDAELKQSKFEVQNILDCKRALVRIALAYIDDHKQLKVLVPIKEYMQKFLPPADRMIRPLFKDFREVLQMYTSDQGKPSATLYVERLTSNYTNIQNTILSRLHPGHPDLTDSIYCTADFNKFSAAIGKGMVPLMDKVITLLPHSRNSEVKAYFTINFLGAYLSSDCEAMIDQTLEHFNDFSDPDLKCHFYIALAHYYYLKHDIPTSLKYSQMALSLAKSHGNMRGQFNALYRLFVVKYNAGDYITGLAYAQEMQRLENIFGDLFREARG